MQNVLKSSILILLLTIVGLTVKSAHGQELSLQEVRAGNSCRNEIYGISSPVSLIVFLTEECELILGNTHITPDTKSYLVLFFIQRFNKVNTSVSDSTKLNRYFHPYSTLGKTKYYVFALREIIV